MQPHERAFLAAVLRYQELRHQRNLDAALDTELTELDETLRHVEAANTATPHDRRVHRRVPTRIRSAAKKDGVCAPCIVVDLSAGGLRMRNQGGLDAKPGDRMTITFRPGDVGLRIDVPVRVRHLHAATGDLGLAFCGPPVVCHARAGGTGQGDRHATRETPLARTCLRPEDISVA